MDELQKHIEEEIKNLIDDLKPEIKKRAVFVFSDKIAPVSKDKVRLAQTGIGFKPPVITIFTRTISEWLGKGVKQHLKEIISHEIIHTFTKEEREAYGKQGKMNFFK